MRVSNCHQLRRKEAVLTNLMKCSSLRHIQNCIIASLILPVFLEKTNLTIKTNAKYRRFLLDFRIFTLVPNNNKKITSYE